MKLKIKSFSFLFAISLLVVSCVTDIPVNTQKTSVIIDARFYLDEDFQVPVQAGKVTVVIQGNDTLAITKKAITIQVPKQKSLRSVGDDLKIIFEEISKFPVLSGEDEFIVRGSYQLMFEDSREGDYDYNDLILYVNSEVVGGAKNRSTVLSVKPIALGSAKQIAFGYVDVNDTDHLLSRDVRRDFFMGEGGFVNTLKNTSYAPVIPMNSSNISYKTTINGNACTVINNVADMVNPEMPTTSGYIKFDPIRLITNNVTDQSGISGRIRYYIEVDNNVRYYIASSDYTVKESLPYGLAFPCEGSYMNEMAPIFTSFPSFMEWIKGSGSDDWYSTAENSENLFTSNKDMGDLYRW